MYGALIVASKSGCFVLRVRWTRDVIPLDQSGIYANTCSIQANSLKNTELKYGMKGGPMIECTPLGICSWNFRLDAVENRAILNFDWLSEQGAITIDGYRFNVTKHGFLSGKWTLDRSKMPSISAQKGFTRSFDIRDTSGHLRLAAESPFGRSFAIHREGSVIAKIAPKHPFTRRGAIRLVNPNVDFATIAFAFWLVVLTWRRAANNSNNQ